MSTTKEIVVVIDLSVRQTSPAGSCVLEQVKGLSKVYDVHLFTSEADDEVYAFATVHKLWTPMKPLILRYLVFWLLVRNKVNGFVKKLNKKPIIQTTQGQYPFSTISYAHFCNKAYLDKFWNENNITGLKRYFRIINHRFNAYLEAKAFKVSEIIITPSEGLCKEIIEYYPNKRGKVFPIANPIDIQSFERPDDFDKLRFRESINISPQDFVISFVALGDFARKGLPELMKSLQDLRLKEHAFKILVVGGKADEIKIYKELAAEYNVQKQIVFAGFQKNIRPYIWASDIFSLPSLYETFSLVCVQAAAAGLPLLVTKLHGVEEYFTDGYNGWLIKKNPQSIAQILVNITQGEYDLGLMSTQANKAVQRYGAEDFHKKWLEVYKQLSSEINVASI